MTLLPLKLLSLVWEPGVDPEIMPLDAEVGIDWIPSICVLSLIGLCLLVQIFYILRGDAKWQPPAPVEASPVAAAAVESEPEAAVASASSSSTPEPPAGGLADKDAVELGIQAWRLQKRVSMLPLQEHPKHKRRLDDSVSQINRLLQKFEVEVEDPIGEVYTDGWVAVEVISSEIVEPWPRDTDLRPYVYETVRPIIRRDGQIIKAGQVIIGEKE